MAYQRPLKALYASAHSCSLEGEGREGGGGREEGQGRGKGGREGGKGGRGGGMKRGGGRGGRKREY